MQALSVEHTEKCKLYEAHDPVHIQVIVYEASSRCPMPKQIPASGRKLGLDCIEAASCYP